MNRRFAKLITSTALFCALLTSQTVQTANAQSDSELRRQNQALATQVQDLERELEAAHARIAELEAQNARLRQQLAAARSAPAQSTAAPSLEPEEVSIDESIPTASPRALLNALVQRYEKATDGLEPGMPGDAARRTYMRMLENWKQTVEREFRSLIEWHVQATDSYAANRARYVSLVAVDPVTGVKLGPPFEVQLTRPLADRLAVLESRGKLGTLVLRGTLIPKVRINEQRETRGSFDNPPFIGPFAEFGFTIDVRSLAPAG